MPQVGICPLPERTRFAHSFDPPSRGGYDLLMSTDPFAVCEATIRRADPDRYFSALFASAEKRPLLFGLYAFNHELTRIGEVVHEPMMGEIRLQWWRETVEEAFEGKPR